MHPPSPTRYDTMQYRRVGRSGLHLPVISLGLWHNFGGVDGLENCRAMLRRAFDLGITHFDLAYNYGPPPGSAEANFGRLFAEDFLPHRDELVISTVNQGWISYVAGALSQMGFAQKFNFKFRSKPKTHAA